MKLLRRLERIEQGRAAALADVGIAWSAYDVELEGHLKAGEYLAVDVVQEPAGQGAVWWRCTERATRDSKDLGLVRSVDGAILGRVTARDRGLVTIEYAADGETPTVASVDRRGRR